MPPLGVPSESSVSSARVVVGGLAACESESGEGSPAVHFAVRDSAGVRIADRSVDPGITDARGRTAQPLALGGGSLPVGWPRYAARVSGEGRQGLESGPVGIASGSDGP
jgi:hypothetical protein|nr:MAG: hypothetical protein DIU52_00195 [bacterium]